MRSALTCLGIIIGIAAVIAMVEIGQGSSHAIQQTIANMGVNQVGIDSLGYTRDELLRLSIHDIVRDVPATEIDALWERKKDLLQRLDKQ